MLWLRVSQIHAERACMKACGAQKRRKHVCGGRLCVDGRDECGLTIMLLQSLLPSLREKLRESFGMSCAFGIFVGKKDKDVGIAPPHPCKKSTVAKDHLGSDGARECARGAIAVGVQKRKLRPS